MAVQVVGCDWCFPRMGLRLVVKGKAVFTRHTACGLQIGVKYRITVYLHSENDCGRPIRLCRTFDNPVIKCFTSEKALFIPSGMDRYIDWSAIPHVWETDNSK